jgi:hypothetical protein
MLGGAVAAGAVTAFVIVNFVGFPEAEIIEG